MSTNGNGSGNGTATPPLNGYSSIGNGRRRRNQSTRRRNQRRLEEQTELHGLPEYLYDSYERLYNIPRNANSNAQVQPPPLLTDACTGNEITYASFRLRAATLATSLATRNHVSTDDTVAILVESNINVPIVATAAWLLGATVVVLSPQLRTDELYAFLSQQQSPRSFFVSRELLGTAAQLITDLGILDSEARPHIVVFDAHDDDREFQTSRDQQVAGVRGSLWGLEDLYIPRPGEYPAERPPLTLSEAQERTAIIYYSHIVEANNQYDVTAIRLFHENVISHYNSSLRRSPSLPDTTVYSYSSSSTPRSQTPISRTPSAYGVEPFAQLDEYGVPTAPYPIAYSVLRMHQVYRLHRIIFNIFCRGAAYVVAPSFVLAEFVCLVDRYAIQYAELTFSETRRLVDYLQMHSLDQPLPRTDWPLHAINIPEGSTPADHLETASIGSMLSTLRFIYTETECTQTELAPALSRLLPHVEVVRTRFGSYVESPITSRD
ncbi:hypothetical protein IW140_000898 [Coemansia sp. RSA 1813]|nr:hypothetical protein EV178_001383 [Coemansia sp. RSA 1646]KAJ1770633.1 hypothetical protein LPJ74_003008 [Coemansia sp. RSA 1843]KAJ2093439.1 hypothetical protein IW138_000289 [Coemansia sp. RSA 986]KAJ2217247.1 hypothetical protein EV179_000714 [Coemansia sp. RSA 487]KAJ2572447.1 hypothetical protein IW140_000898 [Coemansia sp. RSA 1813]